MNVDKDLICKIYELKYIEANGYDGKDYSKIRQDLYPREWNDSEDYDTKIQLLSAAIKEEKKIFETDKYKEIMKGKIL